MESAPVVVSVWVDPVPATRTGVLRVTEAAPKLKLPVPWPMMPLFAPPAAIMLTDPKP